MSDNSFYSYGARNYLTDWNGDKLKEQLKTKVTDMFGKADVDKDGALTMSEVTAQGATGDFSIFDLNDDGKVSEKEYYTFSGGKQSFNADELNTVMINADNSDGWLDGNIQKKMVSPPVGILRYQYPFREMSEDEINNLPPYAKTILSDAYKYLGKSDQTIFNERGNDLYNSGQKQDNSGEMFGANSLGYPWCVAFASNEPAKLAYDNNITGINTETGKSITPQDSNEGYYKENKPDPFGISWNTYDPFNHRISADGLIKWAKGQGLFEGYNEGNAESILTKLKPGDILMHKEYQPYAFLPGTKYEKELFDLPFAGHGSIVTRVDLENKIIYTIDGNVDIDPNTPNYDSGVAERAFYLNKYKDIWGVIYMNDWAEKNNIKLP